MGLDGCHNHWNGERTELIVIILLAHMNDSAKQGRGKRGDPHSPVPKHNECARKEDGRKDTLNSRVTLNDRRTRFRRFVVLLNRVTMPPRAMAFSVGYATYEVGYATVEPESTCPVDKGPT